ncbi:FIST N-terminal domain-containing protein [Kineosporia sp. NBRC 101731]|uniref:FIST signal transduction protein n=1 Tax=Kineosporia sp. NBRC 101731 TaxID=3032199 RepID=UPI0025544739|nr:FIST N-terminal domain-containing protein [Kineosporia sp. NBRC 101731]
MAQLREGLAGRTAAAVLYFASSSYAPEDLAGPMAENFPEAAVLGCSTAGEFTNDEHLTGGISAIALPVEILGRVAAVLGDLTEDPVKGMDRAITELETAWGTPMRDLATASHVGFALIDGLHGDEEMVNERLGNAAPMLDFVGGSAGDDLAFDQTWVAVGDRISHHGVALLLCQTKVAFRVVKTCSLEPSGVTLRITKADLQSRTVQEIDGRPAAQVYAEALGLEESALDASVFLAHPLGLMIDGQAWIRSPQQADGNGGLHFYSQIVEGTEVEMMRGTDLLLDTRKVLDTARQELGGAHSAVLFNCILRRLEMDAKNLHPGFLEGLSGLPTAGFHTYGETWLGHINQTLTGVIFGRP